MRIAVIGCGFGRETLKHAPYVKDVYDIDVNNTILGKAVTFLSERGVGNLTPILAKTFARTVPAGLDLVFSMAVMQHLTRDLVRNHFIELTQADPGAALSFSFSMRTPTRLASMRRDMAAANPPSAGRIGNRSS
jgi:hypothetical protein